MKVYINHEIMKKIKYYIDISDVEISGLGLVEERGNSNFVISDVFLLKQKNTGTSTELDQEDISKLIEKLISEGKDPSKLRFWWHSHVNMKVFWSGTDLNCIEGLCLDKYLFSLVMNKTNEYLMRFDINEPVKTTVEGIIIQILEENDEELFEKCKKEIEEKTK